MSFKSILSDIGHGLKVFFTDAEKVAVAVEPFVDVVFPGIAVLFNATVAAVGSAEANAIAAGAQDGTGAQKLALVTQSLEKDFAAYWAGLGHTVPAPVDTVEKWVNGVVSALNAIPTATPPA